MQYPYSWFQIWSQAKTHLITALLGWIPSLPGLVLRYIFYPIILKKMGHWVRIESDVRFKDAGLVGIGHGTVLRRGVEIDIKGKNTLEIGDGVSFFRDVRISFIGQTGKMKLGNGVNIQRGVELIVHQEGQLEIGDGTYIGSYTYISDSSKLQIGKNCLIAAHSSIIASNHVFADTSRTIKEQGYTTKGIIIEDDCWLGTGVRVLDGVTIGQGSVIGAGAVVTNDIPAYSIAVGVPAKVISKRK